MKPYQFIEETLGNAIKVKILRYFLTAREAQTGRALAHLLAVSSPAALEALNALVQQGVLTKTIIGKSHHFSLNKHHIFVRKALIPLFQFEKNFMEEIGKRIQSALPRPLEAALIYGSLARGTAGSQSDWDILLLCKNEKDKEKIREFLPSKIMEWNKEFSNPFDIKAFTVEEFKNRLRRGDAFARNVYEDYIHSQVPNPLFGKSLIEIMGGKNGQKNTRKKCGPGGI